ncbi:MAG: FMN-binding protein [Saccharofermentanales bacterium]|jgi:electron transport complex protein RnfG
MPNHEKSKQHVPFIERGVVPAIVLTVICAACVALLAVTATITADARAKQEQLMADANKRTLFPEADDFPEELITEAGKSFPANTSIDLTIDHPAVDQVFVVKQGDEVIGAIVRASSKGYAGQLPVMVGFNLEGVIVGIVPDASNETAGLGQNVALAPFTDQFKGRFLSDPFKDIDMVSSSTISSVSVINSVKAAADAFNAFMQIEVEESS